ncbi:hemolysin family protein [Actinomyces minihominis]|uniref:hemolysin family protein n=1 Tax=Actinomyces minihominis TaxID=2002838 RepID=UPI00101AD218|nr:hemolysin family protein [Actinomyces minihominis]
MSTVRDVLPSEIGLVLAIFGVAGMFLGAWFSAVDTALSRMTIAYAEDLVLQGRRGAKRLIPTLMDRRETGRTLAPIRVLATTIGMVTLTVALSAEFWSMNWQWWLTLLVTMAIVAVVQLAGLGMSTRLNSGSRYVTVALIGSRVTQRIYGRARRRRQRTPDSSNGDHHPESRLVVAEELRELLDEVSEDGTPAPLEEEDRKILRSVFELGQTRVGELMVPRSEMITLRGDEDARAALDLFMTSGYSRLPVTGKSLDDIQGVVYLKDVVRRSLKGEGALDIEVKDLARAAEFVPEMKLADDELRVMQTNNTHLALVVDEYGGIAGLVTAEDILEELVGELVDEHDVDVATVEVVEPGVWKVPSSYPIDDLEDLLDVRIDEDDVYSAGGLLAKAIDRVPLPGDQAAVGDVILKAGESTGRRRRVLTIYVRREVSPDGDSGV